MMKQTAHQPRLVTRRQFLAASAVSVAAAAASRVEAWPRIQGQAETVDVFTAGTDGYAHYRIPGLVVTENGSLLAYCEARHDAGGDWGDTDILLRRSTDGGQTWSTRQVLVDVQDDIVNPVAAAQDSAGSGPTANNPVAIAGRSGAVHFLYCVEYARCYSMRSEDDGRTFSEPVDITPVFEGYRAEYPWAVIATGPGHGIELRSGRLLVPVWLSTGEGDHAHRPSAVATIYSDDQGRTWHRGEIVAAHGELYPAEAGGRRSVSAIINPSETVAVELSDGRVMLNIRSESPEARRAVTVSADGVGGWSAPAFDPELYEPVCMGSIARLSPAGDGSGRIVFANPDSRHVPREYGATSGPRENLTIRLSLDDGATWPVSRVLDAGSSGYSDLAVGPDDTIYCFYERGRDVVEGGNAIRHLTLARFGADWITESLSEGSQGQ